MRIYHVEVSEMHLTPIEIIGIIIGSAMGGCAVGVMVMAALAVSRDGRDDDE